MNKDQNNQQSSVISQQNKTFLQFILQQKTKQIKQAKKQSKDIQIQTKLTQQNKTLMRVTIQSLHINTDDSQNNQYQHLEYKIKTKLGHVINQKQKIHKLMENVTLPIHNKKLNQINNVWWFPCAEGDKLTFEVHKILHITNMKQKKHKDKNNKQNEEQTQLVGLAIMPIKKLIKLCDIRHYIQIQIASQHQNHKKDQKHPQNSHKKPRILGTMIIQILIIMQNIGDISIQQIRVKSLSKNYAYLQGRQLQFKIFADESIDPIACSYSTNDDNNFQMWENIPVIPIKTTLSPIRFQLWNISFLGKQKIGEFTVFMYKNDIFSFDPLKKAKIFPTRFDLPDQTNIMQFFFKVKFNWNQNTQKFS